MLAAVTWPDVGLAAILALVPLAFIWGMTR